MEISFDSRLDLRPFLECGHSFVFGSEWLSIDDLSGKGLGTTVFTPREKVDARQCQYARLHVYGSHVCPATLRMYT